LLRELGKQDFTTIDVIYHTRDQSYARVTRAIMAGALSRTSSFIVALDPRPPLPSLVDLVRVFCCSQNRGNTYHEDVPSFAAARVAVDALAGPGEQKGIEPSSLPRSRVFLVLVLHLRDFIRPRTESN